MRNKTVENHNNLKNQDEIRSVAQELDYTQKDAQRNLLDRNSRKPPQKLRESILNNLENIRQGKKTNGLSELTWSKKSRVSGVTGSMISKNTEVIRSRRGAQSMAKASVKSGNSLSCPCETDIKDQDDVNLCKEITNMLINDLKLMKKFNEYRFSKGYDVTDAEQLKKLDNHINFCLSCLNDCFQPNKKEASKPMLQTATLDFD